MLPKCNVASLRITVHVEFSDEIAFRALFNKVKSIILKPPFLRSPIIVFFF